MRQKANYQWWLIQYSANVISYKLHDNSSASALFQLIVMARVAVTSYCFRINCVSYNVQQCPYKLALASSLAFVGRFTSR